VIFSLWPRVIIRLGDGEQHVFDRSRLMFTEVAEIEKVTGLSYGEWERELGRYSITAIGALVHVLRKRDDMPSDFATMQFNAGQLEVLPVHDDGTEYTVEEAAAELTRRIEQAREGPGPTPAAAAAAAPGSSGPATTITSPPSPPSSISARGNGNGSPGKTSSSVKRTSTRS